MSEQALHLDVQDDSFVHFTTASRADAILRTRMIPLAPRDAGGSLVQGVSTTYGRYVPIAHTTHVAASHLDPMVALVFTTSMQPRVGFAEEVVWSGDVPLSSARVVSAREGLLMLAQAAVQLGDDSHVLYGAPVITAAKKPAYKGKKKTEKGNTVYLYSERQIANRNKKKAERLEKLRSSIGNLRKQVAKDLSSKDPETALVALAVALIDETYERVGNDTSAEERGHFGVTGWQRNHISFSKGNATISYTGKSGVDHKKTVSDAKTVKALKRAYDAVEGKEAPIFSPEVVTVDARKVNSYLKKFEVSAKDLRGFHANTLMHEHLREARKAGGKLPEDKKEREKKLKAEFKGALEETAEAVGHEAKTLRAQYLVPGLEDHFLEDGTVTSDMDKTASLVSRFIQAVAD